jgi:beta-N-acetylhexosaminidase
MKPGLLILTALLFIASPVLRSQDDEAPSAFGKTPVEESSAPSPPSELPLEAPQPETPPHVRYSPLIFATLEGLQGPSAADVSLLKHYPPGGVVIPRLVRAGSAKVYLEAVRDLGRHGSGPLLVGADLYTLTRWERGAASPFLPLPSFLTLAAGGDPKATRRMGDIVAEHLAVLGFNVCLGPQLALAPTLASAPGSIHCWGSDANFAAKAATAFCEALGEHGLLAMPMGFPGGGLDAAPGTSPVLTTPRAQLVESELRPYVAAVAAGVSLMHVGVTLTPTLDPAGPPACLSSLVLKELLRERLAYAGVIVAGPVDDPGMMIRYDPAEAAIRALEAGADMIYVRGGAAMTKRIVDHIVQAVADGRLEEERLEEALGRIAAIKAELRERPPGKLSSQALEKLEKRKDFMEEIEMIEAQGITLVQNRNGLLPLSKDRSLPVGVIGSVGVMPLHDALEKELKRVFRHRITTARHVGRIQDFEIRRIIDKFPGGGTIVCIFGSDIEMAGQRRLLEELKAKSARVVVVYLGYPKGLEEFRAADALLAVYCAPEALSQSMAAVGDALLGKAPVRIIQVDTPLQLQMGQARRFSAAEVCQIPGGRLPVHLSEALPAGSAVSLATMNNLRQAQWDFGNGARLKGFDVEYTYSEAGDYTLQLVLKDKQGRTTEGAFSVHVE